MSDKVISIMDKPKDCQNCVWGICKYSTPLSTNRKGYYCQLKVPKDRTVEDFAYADEVHLKNCPLVSVEEHDKGTRNKVINEIAEKMRKREEPFFNFDSSVVEADKKVICKFAEWCYINGIDFSHMPKQENTGNQFINDIIDRYCKE